MNLTRRAFLGSGASTAVSFAESPGPASLDQTLRSGIARRKLPCVVGAVANRSKTLYTGSFGRRDDSGVAVRADSIFQIASMTKAITSAAALQLVDQGKVTLDEPLSKHLPQLANLDVLDGTELRPARTPITLRHLLTHTSGFCYDIWDERAFQYAASKPPAYTKPGPLMFEPGTHWQYGQGVDWAGRLVEAISGATLEDYFQEKILRPLGMVDTSYILPAPKFDRMVSNYHREPSGDLKQDARTLPARPKEFNGGGGLFSTVADYVAFMQMILNRGASQKGARILKPQTVDSMLQNQIGELTAGKMKSLRPTLSSDVDVQPGHSEKWGLGFLINTTAYEGGRSAGSGAWAGLFNTFYWIDPKRDRCGVIMMQLLPFVDKDAVGMLDEFETATYRYL